MDLLHNGGSGAAPNTRTAFPDLNIRVRVDQAIPQAILKPYPNHTANHIIQPISKPYPNHIQTIFQTILQTTLKPYHNHTKNHIQTMFKPYCKYIQPIFKPYCKYIQPIFKPYYKPYHKLYYYGAGGLKPGTRLAVFAGGFFRK